MPPSYSRLTTWPWSAFANSNHFLHNCCPRAQINTMSHRHKLPLWVLHAHHTQLNFHQSIKKNLPAQLLKAMLTVLPKHTHNDVFTFDQLRHKAKTCKKHISKFPKYKKQLQHNTNVIKRILSHEWKFKQWKHWIVRCMGTHFVTLYYHCITPCVISILTTTANDIPARILWYNGVFLAPQTGPSSSRSMRVCACVHKVT